MGDTGDQAWLLRALAWSACGGVIGGFFGILLALLRGWPMVPAIFIGFAAGAGSVYGGSMVAGHAAAGAIVSILDPSGRTTPPRPDYSLAESLVIRGRHEEAVLEYEHLASTLPADPQPRVRLARLYRDRLGRPDDAVRWFRRARETASIDAAADRLIVVELMELLERTGRLAEALPELAKLADRHPASAEAGWARSRSAGIRRSIEDSNPS